MRNLKIWDCPGDMTRTPDLNEKGSYKDYAWTRMNGKTVNRSYAIQNKCGSMKNTTPIYYAPYRMGRYSFSPKGTTKGIVCNDTEPGSANAGLNGLYGVWAGGMSTLHHQGSLNLLITDNSVISTPKASTEEISNTTVKSYDNAIGSWGLTEYDANGNRLN